MDDPNPLREFTGENRGEPYLLPVNVMSNDISTCGKY